MPAPASEHTVGHMPQQFASMAHNQPSLQPLFTAFGQVQEAVAHCRALLPPPDAAALAPDPALLEQGVPLLEQPSVSIPLGAQLDQAALVILPAVAAGFPALDKACATFGAALRHDGFAARCHAMLQDNGADGPAALAAELGVDADALIFLLQCLVRPELEACAAAAAPALEQTPWTVWNRGLCPVCGGAPAMSILQLGPQEPTEYLKNVSAQRWLCCASCAHTWRISRTLCPSCGQDTHEAREYFNVEGNPQERVELCRHCNHYLLTVDMRDRMTPVDHRLAPLGLVHLDMLAQQRGYQPQAVFPWTMPPRQG
ncbi:MAG: formate dehydrogenase accessory protein FdhE [Desulfovibrionaceae bacterium]